MPIPDEALLSLLKQALDAEIGLSVQISDRRWLINSLYRVRKEADDPFLEGIVIYMPQEPNDEVFICKREAQTWLET